MLIECRQRVGSQLVDRQCNRSFRSAGADQLNETINCLLGVLSGERTVERIVASLVRGHNVADILFDRSNFQLLNVRDERGNRFVAERVSSAANPVVGVFADRKASYLPTQSHRVTPLSVRVLAKAANEVSKGVPVLPLILVPLWIRPRGGTTGSG